MFLNKNKPAGKAHDSVSLGEIAKSHATPGQRLLAYGLMVIATIILIGFAWWRSKPPSVSGAGETVTEPTLPPKMQVPVSVEAPVAVQPPPGMAPQDPQMPQAANLQQQQQQQQPPVDQAREQARAQAAADRASALERKLSPGFEGEEDQRLSPAADPVDGQGGAAQAGAPTGSTGLGAMLVPTSMPATVAGMILNPHTTMISGTTVTCSLGTAISTEQSGVGFCTLDFPVKSMNGYAVLLDSGTRVNYEYARGMAHGAKSIFILYTDAITPEGVYVQLASPGTDPLGRSGLAGKVDSKWMARYSGALMFSLLQDAVALGGGGRGGNSGGNTQINLPNTQGMGTNAAGEILRQNSDVQPSMEVAHGTSVGITVAGNKDFSRVYGFKLKEATQ